MASCCTQSRCARMPPAIRYTLLLYLLGLGIPAIHGNTTASPQSSEARVREYLKSRAEVYGNSRPVLDTTRNVTVAFGLRLIQLTVDEKANLLTTSVWIRQKWRDEYLTWNASDYDGVARVGIPSDWIWTPDVTLVNTGSTDDDTRRAEVRVSSDGSIFWLLHRVYSSACLVDLRDYPFDQQTCHLWFQSLSHPSKTMDIKPYTPGFDLDTYLSDFKEADEWKIISNESVRVRSPRELGELLMFSRRVTLRLSLTMRRRAGFQAYLLCIPCVVLGAMSVLVFVLPPERPDRHAIATTLLGSFVLLLLILVQTAPPSAASIPRLGLLYAANIGVIIISLALSAIVVNVAKRGDKGIPYPKALEKITRTMALICCIPCPPPPKPDPLIDEKYHLQDNGLPGNSEEKYSPPGVAGTVTDHLQNMEVKMSRIESVLNRLSTILSRPQRRGPADGARWKVLAGVLDKVFLLIQCVLIITTACLLYPKAHY